MAVAQGAAAAAGNQERVLARLPTGNQDQVLAGPPTGNQAGLVAAVAGQQSLCGAGQWSLWGAEQWSLWGAEQRSLWGAGQLRRTTSVGATLPSGVFLRRWLQLGWIFVHQQVNLLNAINFKAVWL